MKLLDELPPELLAACLEYLGARDLIHIACVCKGFASIADYLLCARFREEVLDPRADYVFQLEASSPCDCRATSSLVLDFASFLPPAIASEGRDGPACRIPTSDAARHRVSSRARLTVPPSERSHCSFRLEDDEYFQTFQINLMLRSRDSGRCTVSAAARKFDFARDVPQYRIGNALNLVVDSVPGFGHLPRGADGDLATGGGSAPSPPVESEATARSKTRVHSEVNVIEGLERVWRSWFDTEPAAAAQPFAAGRRRDGAPHSPQERRAAAATTAAAPPAPQPPSRETKWLTATRTIEVDSMTAVLGLYHPAPAAAPPPQSQRMTVFEMAWLFVECDVAKVLYAMEQAERARSSAAIWCAAQGTGLVAVH